MKAIPSVKLAGLENFTPRIIALLCLLILLLSVLAGCKCPAHASSTANPGETYVLVSVDDQAVPCAVTHGRTRMTIKSGAFIINPDGTCRSLITFALAEQPDRTREVKATYMKNGATLNMSWQGAGRTIGQLNGEQFTMKNEEMVFIYHK